MRAMLQEVRSTLRVPGVLGFVGSRRGPWALQDDEIEIMRGGLALRHPEPHSYLVKGQRVRIVRGPMAGLVGILERSPTKSRLVLSVDLVTSSVAVEVHANELEPVGSLSLVGGVVPFANASAIYRAANATSRASQKC